MNSKKRLFGVSNYFKKFFVNIEYQGIISTLIKTYSILNYEAKLTFTKIKLTLTKKIKKKDLIIKYNGCRFIYKGEGDRGELIYHAFWRKLFNEERDHIINYIKLGDTVLDIGANYGFFSLILSELVGKTGMVYAFEPSVIIFNRLIQTIKINELRNVTAQNFGFGDEERMTTIYYNPNQTGLTSIRNESNINLKTEEVFITTLNIFRKSLNKKISFIKIDTEGCEPNILRGAKEVLLNDRPIILIELGGVYQESSRESIFLLKGLNYKCEAENVDLSIVPSGTNFIAIPDNPI